MNLHVSRESTEGNYQGDEYPRQATGNVHLAHSSSSESPFPIYSVLAPVQSQPSDIQDREVMFPHNQDPMATLAALAAMASGQIDNF